MSTFNVAPRYTSGSPAQVSVYIAERVATEERTAYNHALKGVYGAELQMRARELGLDGIAVKKTWESGYEGECLVTEDLITGKVTREVDRTEVEIDVDIGGHRVTVMAYSRAKAEAKVARALQRLVDDV